MQISDQFPFLQTKSNKDWVMKRIRNAFHGHVVALLFTSSRLCLKTKTRYFIEKLFHVLEVNSQKVGIFWFKFEIKLCPNFCGGTGIIQQLHFQHAITSRICFLSPLIGETQMHALNWYSVYKLLKRTDYPRHAYLAKHILISVQTTENNFILW